MDMDTYVSTERVHAGQVRKPTEIVTSDGKFTAERYSYIVETTVQNELGQDYVVSRIMSQDEFNAAYKRLDWRDEDRKAAKAEGYDEGYDDGWNAAVSANAAADKIVPPVGDKLETDGPVSARPVVESSHDEATDEDPAVSHDPAGEGDGVDSGGPASAGEGIDSGSDSRSSESGGL